MAEGKKIEEKDVIKENLFDNYNQSITEAIELSYLFESGLKTILKAQSQILTKSGRVLTDPKKIKEANDELQKTSKVVDLIEQTTKNRVKLEEKLVSLRSDSIQQEEEVKLLISEQQRINKQLAKDALNLQNAYQKGAKRLNELKKSLKDLEFTGKTNTKIYKDLRKEFEVLDPKVRKAEQSVGEFGRSVGRYKQDIADAIRETNLFNGSLFEGVRAFKNYTTSVKESGKEQGKFNTILKATGIGLAVLTIAALKKIGDQFLEVSQQAQDAAFLFQKFFDAAVTNEAAKAFISTLKQTRPELRGLSKDLQEVNNELSDLDAISSDESISIGLRNAAIERSIELNKQKADLEIKVAEANLRNAQAEVNLAGSKIGNEKVVNDLLVKQTEAENALSAARDKRSDLEVESARRQRKLTQEQITNNIELLRSQRLSANARQKELENEIANEKNQLEERIKLAKELDKVNQQSTDEQAKQLEKAGIDRKIFDELVATSNEVELKALVRKNLANIEGTIIEKELFKVVKEAQDNRIKNNETIKKFQEEELARQKKILEIQEEIRKIQREDQLQDLEISIEQGKNLIDKIEEEILKSKNSLNPKLLKKRKDFNEQLRIDEAQLLSQQEENLRLAAEAEKKKIEASINDEKIRAEEIKKIEEQLQIDLENLRRDAGIKEFERKKEQLEKDKEIAKKQLEIIADTLSKSFDIASQQIDKENQKKEDAIDREIEQREKNIERQQELAEKGLENSLAFELQKKEEAELKKRELEEEAAREKEIAQLSEAYLEAYIAELQQPGANPATAAFRALADVLAAQAIGKTIAGAFKDGVEKLEGPGTATSDSILIRASRGEGVAKAKAVSKDPGLITAMNKGKVKEYTENVLIPKYNIESTSVAGNQKTKFYESDTSSKEVVKSMNELIKVTKDKPVPSIEIDKFGNVFYKIMTDGMTKVTKYKRRSRL